MAQGLQSLLNQTHFDVCDALGCNSFSFSGPVADTGLSSEVLAAMSLLLGLPSSSALTVLPGQVAMASVGLAFPGPAGGPCMPCFSQRFLCLGEQEPGSLDQKQALVSDRGVRPSLDLQPQGVDTGPTG